MSPQILLVEDDVTLRFLVADALSILHANVTECGTADEALKVLQAQPVGASFDLVLTDIRMPGDLDGLDLAQIIWAGWPGLPVILMSGHRLVAAELLPSHSTFMAKPWTLDQLFEVVGKRLQRPWRGNDWRKWKWHGHVRSHRCFCMLSKGY